MKHMETFNLSSELLPDTKSTITFDTFNSEGDIRRGTEIPQRKEREGRITFNPDGCQIFSLQSGTGQVSSQMITQDRALWDFYLVVMRFTLHKVQGEGYYKEITFLVEMTDEHTIAFDLFPGHITTDVEAKLYTLSPDLTIIEAETNVHRPCRQIRFTSLRPTITAFGEGESIFYWVYEASLGSKGVEPETKNALIVLQTPHRTTSVTATIGYEAVIAKQRLGVWAYEDGKTEKRQIQWDLSKATPFCEADVAQVSLSGGQRLLHSMTSKGTSMDSQTHLSKAVILTALSLEYEAIRHHLKDIRRERHPQGTIYEVGTFISHTEIQWNIAIAETGQGNTRAAFETERAVTYFKPDVAFFVGVAGGLKDVRIGDVVVATRVYNYESGKIGETFYARPDTGNSTYAMVQYALAESKRQDWLRRLDPNIIDPAPHVFLGPIATGEKVLASTRSDIRTFLRTSYNDALAVDMESHGFLQTMHAHPSVQALIIRGISDLLDDKHKSDAANSQPMAVKHASAFAFEVLANSLL